jgi:uncharacterized protein (TIGR02186 family)
MKNLGYRKILFALALALALPNNSYSRAIVADINPRKIDIDQNFKGTKLLVYGARNDAGNIVVVVRGPKENQILRKKGKVFGVWTNTENIELNNLYSYYSIASMRPLTAVQNDSLLKELEIGQYNIKLSKDEDYSPAQMAKIKNSMIELMQNKSLYSKKDYEISFWGETLFRTFIDFPKNITNGLYNIDIYLFSDGQLHSYQTMPLIVEKVGLEAFITNMAHKRPLLYGLVSVQIALVIGLLVGAIFAKKH